MSGRDNQDDRRRRSGIDSGLSRREREIKESMVMLRELRRQAEGISMVEELRRRERDAGLVGPSTDSEVPSHVAEEYSTQPSTGVGEATHEHLSPGHSSFVAPNGLESFPKTSFEARRNSEANHAGRPRTPVLSSHKMNGRAWGKASGPTQARVERTNVPSGPNTHASGPSATRKSAPKRPRVVNDPIPSLNASRTLERPSETLERIIGATEVPHHMSGIPTPACVKSASFPRGSSAPIDANAGASLRDTPDGSFEPVVYPTLHAADEATPFSSLSVTPSVSPGHKKAMEKTPTIEVVAEGTQAVLLADLAEEPAEEPTAEPTAEPAEVSGENVISPKDAVRRLGFCVRRVRKRFESRFAKLCRDHTIACDTLDNELQILRNAMAASQKTRSIHIHQGNLDIAPDPLVQDKARPASPRSPRHSEEQQMRRKRPRTSKDHLPGGSEKQTDICLGESIAASRSVHPGELDSGMIDTTAGGTTAVSVGRTRRRRQEMCVDLAQSEDDADDCVEIISVRNGGKDVGQSSRSGKTQGTTRRARNRGSMPPVVILGEDSSTVEKRTRENAVCPAVRTVSQAQDVETLQDLGVKSTVRSSVGGSREPSLSDGAAGQRVAASASGAGVPLSSDVIKASGSAPDNQSNRPPRHPLSRRSTSHSTEAENSETVGFPPGEKDGGARRLIEPSQHPSSTRSLEYLVVAEGMRGSPAVTADVAVGKECQGRVAGVADGQVEIVKSRGSADEASVLQPRDIGSRSGGPSANASVAGPAGCPPPVAPEQSSEIGPQHALDKRSSDPPPTDSRNRLSSSTASGVTPNAKTLGITVNLREPPDSSTAAPSQDDDAPSHVRYRVRVRKRI